MQPTTRSWQSLPMVVGLTLLTIGALPTTADADGPLPPGGRAAAKAKPGGERVPLGETPPATKPEAPVAAPAPAPVPPPVSTSSRPARSETPRDTLKISPIQRMRTLTEEMELLGKFAEVPEVGITDKPAVAADLLHMAQLRSATNPASERTATPAEKHYSQVPSPEGRTQQKEIWQGLGFSVDPEATVETAAADARLMAELGRRFRRERIVTTPGRQSRRADPSRIEEILEDSELVEKRAGVDKSSPVPTLVQMLQAEEPETRLLLVQQLAKYDTPASTAGLAGRALFDTAPLVRAAAVGVLRDRPRDQVRKQLLEGIRHPWPAAAEHAAEAIVALKDRDAGPALKKLLDEPSPLAPFTPAGDKTALVREVVRVNHLKNCLLCHEPSTGRREALIGFVPVRGQPLPPEYYASRESKPDDVFVRADVVYLRQDFSLTLPVRDAKPWPDRQRFDFVVRTRPATEAEIAAANKPDDADPHRQAIRFALKQLEALGVEEAAKAP